MCLLRLRQVFALDRNGGERTRHNDIRDRRSAQWLRKLRLTLGSDLPDLLPQFGSPSETVNDGSREQSSSSWLSLVLRDVHFWVPVAVLAGGLLVLRWIS